MSGLQSKLEPIREETAQDLLGVINSVPSKTPFDDDAMEHCLGNIKNQVMANLKASYLLYARKCCNASFVTRWYWRKKYIKVFNDIIKFKQISNESN